MKAALLGAGGQVGTAILRQAEQNSAVSICPLYRNICDISNAADVHKQLSRHKKEQGCTLVINAAAWTAVDQAETQETQAMAINHQGSANVAAACAALDLPLIYFSTDYVFDGRKTIPYTETDTVNPLSVYGRSKAMGEQIVCKTVPRHIILRTSWVFSPYGQNFLKTMMRLAAERDSLKIVADQIGGPTPAADIAKAVSILGKSITEPNFKDWGIYHYSGSPSTSWHGFASCIMEALKQRNMKTPSRVEDITTDQYPLPAARPAFSVLSCSKIKDVFNISQPDWQTGIESAIDEILKAG